MASGSADGSVPRVAPFTGVGGANCIGSRLLIAITILLQFVIDLRQITGCFARGLIFADCKPAPNGFSKCNILMEARCKHWKTTLAQIGFSFFRQERSALDGIEHNPAIYSFVTRYRLNNLLVERFRTTHIWQRRESGDEQEVGYTH